MALNITETTYKGFGKCISLSNGSVEILVTVDMGPRIIKLCGPDGENMFCEVPEYVGENGWKMQGGHRLWHSPEATPRTYERDDKPVRWEKIEGGIRTMQEIEKSTGIEKEMEILMDEELPSINILHRIRNRGLWPVELAAWSISVMAPGGKEVVPMTQRDTGLLGNRMLGLWPYSRMNDHRVWWGTRYITLQQDPNTKPPFKFGINNEYGWVAYFNKGKVFVKQHNHDIDEVYPDGGLSYQTYTTDFMLEMESLSPLVKLDPEDEVEHWEYWALLEGIDAPANDDDAIDEVMDMILDTSGCECGCGCGDCDCDCDEDCDCESGCGEGCDCEGDE